MSLAACVFALRLRSPGRRAEAERRAEALAARFAPLGEARPVLRACAGDRVVVGAIAPGARPPDPEGMLVWGAWPRADVDLLTAGDAELRRLDGPLGAMVAGPQGAVAVSAAGGGASLFAAEGPVAEAWSSHAVAAAWLAGLEPRVDADGIAELLASEHLAGRRTTIAGVRALPQATRVEIGAGTTVEACFWPAADRWAPLAPEDAAATARRELLESLTRRLGVDARPVIGLTAGLDSLVALVALRELGLPVRAFTYGERDGPDALGAAAVASALGIEHGSAGFEWWDDEPGMALLRAEACWFDGARPAGFADVPWPEMSHWLAGIGGETGRAFLYRWCRPRGDREPSREALARVLDIHFAGRMAGADAGVREALRRRWRERVDAAQELGVTGWRTLDVVYSEQRVRRWGRAMLPRVHAAAVPVFATPGMQRALAWLPLEDRVSDGFGRRFVAAHAPELQPPAPVTPARSLLPPLARRRTHHALRAARRSLRLPRPARRREPWFTHPPWDERPLFVEWLLDAVLRSPLLEGAVGAGWLRAMRAAFLRGDPAAAELTMWAASVVALDEGLRELRQSDRH